MCWYECLKKRGRGENIHNCPPPTHTQNDDQRVWKDWICAVLLHRTALGPVGFMEAGFGSMSERLRARESCPIIEPAAWGDGESEQALYLWKCSSRAWVAICCGYCGKIPASDR